MDRRVSITFIFSENGTHAAMLGIDEDGKSIKISQLTNAVEKLFMGLSEKASKQVVAQLGPVDPKTVTDSKLEELFWLLFWRLF